jgi:HK97 family phage portal protein
MGIFDKFFQKQEPTQKKEAPKIVFNKIDAYGGKHSNRKYRDYAKEGYQENAIVHRCIQLISNSASSVKIDVFDGDTKLDNHELISLLQRPNPTQSGIEFFSSMYSFLMISGNSYILRDSDSMRPPNELYLLRPDRIQIKSSQTAIPSSYDYVIDGVTINKYAVDQANGMSQIKHIKLWNPIDDYYGLSPIMASAYNIDQHNLAGLHNVALLKNGATPSGYLKFQPTDETGMSTQLTDDQRARLLEDLEFRFQGTHNSGRPMLLEGNFDYKQLGLSPKDMDFLDLLNLSAREIALCFGVPAQLIGIPEANTYSNMETAKLGLYEETIIPLLKRVESDLNEYLSPLYSGDINIRYDLDSIPAMAEKRKQVYENVVQGVQAGILTRNEARDRLGLEEVSGGDDLYIPSNLFPIGETMESDEDNDSPVDPEGAQKDFDSIYGTKARVDFDTYTTEEEAIDRAEEIGCVGTHSHEQEGRTVYMPCRTHAEYEEALRDNKAIEDLDLVPTDGMVEEAKRGLEWRKEHKRGGTQVGVTRANQIVNKTRLSANTVLRMYSFFSRHEVDKQAEGFDRGEDGYPSAGRIAWALWGGDAGFSWSKGKRDQIMRERDEKQEEKQESVSGVSGSTLKALKNKVKEHNDKHGDKKGKRVTTSMLARVFKRGIGAYRNNPSSVRPSVRAQGGEDRWAFARVNTFLSAVRTGRFSGGKFDLDLLPKDHPLSSKD